MDYDIAIAGYGPVGATLANLLGQGGFRVAVLEQDVDIYDKPRAITMDHEVSRVFQACGLADEIDPLTAPHPGTNFVDPAGEVIKRFDPLPPPYPLGWRPTSVFIQPELEAALRHGVARFETVDVMLGRRVDGFSQNDDAVEVMFTELGSGQPARLRTRYLIGCDGASSLIRFL